MADQRTMRFMPPTLGSLGGAPRHPRDVSERRRAYSLDVAWTFPAIRANWCGMKLDRAESAAGRKESMNILLIILGVIAVILLLTGGFVPTLNFLLWVGIVIAVIALIVWLVRMISGRRVV